MRPSIGGGISGNHQATVNPCRVTSHTKLYRVRCSTWDFFRRPCDLDRATRIRRYNVGVCFSTCAFYKADLVDSRDIVLSHVNVHSQSNSIKPVPALFRSTAPAESQLIHSQLLSPLTSPCVLWHPFLRSSRLPSSPAFLNSCDSPQCAGFMVCQSPSQFQFSAESLPRPPETAVTMAANVDLSTVGKPDDEYTPPSRPHNGDTYVRRTGSTRNSVRNSRIVVQTGSHHSVALPVRPGQVVRVSSTRSHIASSRISIPDAPRRASQLLLNDPDYGHPLVHTASPPVIRR